MALIRRKVSHSQTAARQRQRQRQRQIIANAGSVRLFLTVAFVALVVGGLFAQIWRPLGYVAIPVFAVAWIAGVVSPASVLHCPYCRKRVKVGASACHHCGRIVAVGP